ncbi:MAG: saccharopine dehydrogenase NADP-binding domain-containing protein [Thermoplasmata archaeon]|nr:saccharopine dehydrogenase NADP-binding domain-containing protein [Thermoplasmata archaeon]
MTQKNYLVMGAGQMGKAIAFDIVKFSPDDRVTLTDMNEEAGREIAAWLGGNVSFTKLDASDRAQIICLMEEADIAIVALPYSFNLGLLELAIQTGTHFCDLGGNDSIVGNQLKLNEKAMEAGILGIPDCGLAPGMTNVIAMHSIKGLDKMEKLHIRVGGLPQNPKPPLNYQLFFSVKGLVNEYKEPCMVLEDGKITHLEPMVDLETLHFDGLGEMEAFNTSGGAAWLPYLLEGKVNEMNYKTIRYPGHAVIIKAMLDLGLADEEEITCGCDCGCSHSPRDILETQFVKNLTGNDKDIVLVRVAAEGMADGKPVKITYDLMDRFDEETGLTAMMRTTSFPTAIIAQMIVNGQIGERGVFTPEMVTPGDIFLEELGRRNILFDKKIE